jgi:NAD(P)-dependent dehydrogenase (short-subunit alcohol dehydrogenase family)
MESFEGRLAVVTGGGTGMGRELVVQLAAQGCSVATCDVNLDTLEITKKIALEGAPEGVKVTTHECNVADAAQMERFAGEVRDQHATDHVHLVFNNAGIGGGGSFVSGRPEDWERTFGVCWGGVYNGSRSFLPMLVKADEGVLVNTSSVNGFWASVGPGVSHTAYSAAKFAVKGFSEALIEDLRLNAPHVSVAVVMPGHIGTDIVLNSRRIHSGSDELSAEEIAEMRRGAERRGMPVAGVSDEELAQFMQMMGEGFRDNAPMTAAQAATVILEAVRAGRWRILVGDDAHKLDEAVRADPENAYEPGALTLGILGAG